MLKLSKADQYKSLPLMESFLREAARYDPLDSCKANPLNSLLKKKKPNNDHLIVVPHAVSVQRKVLKDFTFSDGTHVPAGNVICVPQQAIMRDAQHYDRPDEFMPFRFVTNHHQSEGKNGNKAETDDEAAHQKFTDLKPHFYLWGAAKNPWCVSSSPSSSFISSLSSFPCPRLFHGVSFSFQKAKTHI